MKLFNEDVEYLAINSFDIRTDAKGQLVYNKQSREIKELAIEIDTSNIIPNGRYKTIFRIKETNFDLDFDSLLNNKKTTPFPSELYNINFALEDFTPNNRKKKYNFVFRYI